MVCTTVDDERRLRKLSGDFARLAVREREEHDVVTREIGWRRVNEGEMREGTQMRLHGCE